MIKNNNMVFSYSHVSPNFIIKVGDYINKNQYIGNVGPKYIDSIKNNPYKDSTRSPNKWRNYRMPFAF